MVDTIDAANKVARIIIDRGPVPGMKVGELIREVFGNQRRGPWTEDDFAAVFDRLYADPRIGRYRDGRSIPWASKVYMERMNADEVPGRPMQGNSYGGVFR